MLEIDLCQKIAGIPILAEYAQNRILAMDFRAASWANAVNYLEEPVTVMQSSGYILPTIVVDRTGVRRSLVLRGPGRFMDTVDIWIYGPVGIVGYESAVAVKETIENFHQHSLPNRQMMMLSGAIGPINDPTGKNLMANISFDLTRVMEDINGE